MLETLIVVILCAIYALFVNASSRKEEPRERFNSRGNYDTNTEQSSKHSKNRVTYCYSCKTDLTSKKDEECDSCGWLICPVCGACGYDCAESKSHYRLNKQEEVNDNCSPIDEDINDTDDYKFGDAARIRELQPFRVEQGSVGNINGATTHENSVFQNVIEANLTNKFVRKEKIARRYKTEQAANLAVDALINVFHVTPKRFDATGIIYDALDLDKPLLSASAALRLAQVNEARRRAIEWENEFGSEDYYHGEQYEDLDRKPFSDHTAEMNDWENKD